MRDAREGVLVYNTEIQRFDIRFGLEEYYGGLHCGECFEIQAKGIWIPVRIELNRNVLNTLSICKAGEGRGIVPPLTNGNMADDRIGDAETMISGRMEHWGVCESCFW